MRRLGVPTITLYPLVIRERTVYGRLLREGGGSEFAAPRTRYEWHDRAVAALSAAGLAQRTLVLFSRESSGNRQEESEFEGTHTLGMSAPSPALFA